MSTQISNTDFLRPQIRAQWNSMHQQYHELVRSIPPEAYKRPTVDTKWSVGEILIHMIQSLEMVPRAIDALRRGKDFLNLPITLVGASSYFLVKLMARNSSMQALLARYDRAFNAATHAWDQVGEEEWSKGACLFGEGYKTLLLYYQHGIIHFEEHAAQVRKSLMAAEGRN